MIVLDYIFYRLAHFFFKKDGMDAIRTLIIISVLETIVVGEVLFLVVHLNYEILGAVKGYIFNGKIGMFILILLFILNYIRYKGKYWRYSERWKNTESESQRKIRGFLVLAAILLPVLLFFLMATSGYRK